jgi:hypothetical protein
MTLSGHFFVPDTLSGDDNSLIPFVISLADTIEEWTLCRKVSGIPYLIAFIKRYGVFGSHHELLANRASLPPSRIVKVSLWRRAVRLTVSTSASISEATFAGSMAPFLSKCAIL